MTELLVRGGRVLGASAPVDVAVGADGRIAEVSPHDGNRAATNIVDAGQIVAGPYS